MLSGALVPCPGCGGQAAGPAGACPACLQLPADEVQRLPGLISLGRHDGTLRALVQALKFRSAHRLAAPLGAALASAVRRCGVRPLAVTYVPLHPARQAARGYNQAEAVAVSCAAALGIPCLRLLKRQRMTVQQARLPTASRPGNAAGAFALARSAPVILPRRVLLVDDVLTTGSTLEACRQVLLMAGSEEVIFGVLATARPRPAPTG